MDNQGLYCLTTIQGGEVYLHTVLGLPPFARRLAVFEGMYLELHVMKLLYPVYL